MALVSKPMFWGIGNPFGPFSEASDRQELSGQAVQGQGGPQEVKFELRGSNSACEHARDMVLVAKPMFWGMTMMNYLGSFSEASRTVGGQAGLQEMKF